ncbi:DNA-binding protein [Salinispora cortesiana]|uniref:DNA-binding protein n=1 Tax=Salinispora cortesiana TaxID=1305843 RepID=UPI0009B768A2|nr:DNA-binding protein [Salinispora cortesiana]
MSKDGTNEPWTIESVRALGVTTDVATAGSILGIGRSKAYTLAQQGQFPVQVIRVGRSYVVPIPAILELLGVSVVRSEHP